MDGNEAASYISYAFTETAAIYPITPSSPMATHVDEWAANGNLIPWTLVIETISTILRTEFPRLGKTVDCNRFLMTSLFLVQKRANTNKLAMLSLRY